MNRPPFVRAKVPVKAPGQRVRGLPHSGLVVTLADV
jgi:hypothetical protein